MFVKHVVEAFIKFEFQQTKTISCWKMIDVFYEKYSENLNT